MDEWLLLINNTVNGLTKLFEQESLTEEETQAIKDFLTGYSCLRDMDETQKIMIQNATKENIIEVVKETFIQTAHRSFQLRYGISIQ